MSHLSQVRGLKYQLLFPPTTDADVAPFTGAWIEIITDYLYIINYLKVAPFTGAWIEII